MENESVFDTKLLEERIKEIGDDKPEFIIGIDTYDTNLCSYCLVMNHKGETTLIMVKTMRDENQFKEEVENLAKYFNAEILKER